MRAGRRLPWTPRTWGSWYGVRATGGAPRTEPHRLLRGFGLAVPVAHTGRGKAHGECGAVATCPAIRAWLLGLARDQHHSWHRLAAGLVSVACRPAREPA